MEFATLTKVIAFVSITSLVGIYAVSDGWEMRKLILQQGFLSALLIVSMIYYRKHKLAEKAKKNPQQAKAK